MYVTSFAVHLRQGSLGVPEHRALLVRFIHVKLLDDGRLGRCVRVHLCPSRCNPMGFLVHRRSLPFTTSPGGRHNACRSRQQGVCCRRQEAGHTCRYQHVTGAAQSCWLCRDRVWVSLFTCVSHFQLHISSARCTLCGYCRCCICFCRRSSIFLWCV